MNCLLDPTILPASVEVSRFAGRSGVDEFHLVVEPTDDSGFAEQLAIVEAAYPRALSEYGLGAETAVFLRWFCSDPTNQAALLPHHDCAVSCVGQPPLPPARVALWAYHVKDPAGPLDKRRDGNTLTLSRGPLTHLWCTGIASEGGDSHAETRGVFERYNGILDGHGMRLSEHALRTWLFVRDIDADYAGLVSARREFFAAHGLSAATHFIASSGIGGAAPDAGVRVHMDAWAIGGLAPGQVEYLAAPGHLSPTHVYGVTFERATAVSYADRRHVIISGTASIDREGRIVHEGDVMRQLDRTLENVTALLSVAGARVEDMLSWIVYVRDPSDQAAVRAELRERLAGAPVLVVAARVCRPGWLVEVEGLAALPARNGRLPAF